MGVRAGGIASFFCSARGDPQPTIVWRKNGKKVPGTQTRYSVTEAGGVSILRIEPVRSGRDDAPYECVAENGVADAVSAEATLTVYDGEFDWDVFVDVRISEYCIRPDGEMVRRWLAVIVVVQLLTFILYWWNLLDWNFLYIVLFYQYSIDKPIFQ